jgi:HAD superfamily hydrolase (TIGR01509 family)
VLVDSEPIVNRVFVDMLAELGYPLDYETTLRHFSGGNMAKRLAYMKGNLGWIAPDGFTDEFHRRLRSALERALRPVPGILGTLVALQTPWCVASNGTHEDMRTRLGIAGLLAKFDPRLFSATEVKRPKPAPDLFVHAAAAMGAAPDRCVVVEDSVPGVEAGVAAGMTVFGFTRITEADALRNAGANVFDDMSLLPDRLRA